jgi:CheY-like chemotaxis protein
MKTLLIVDDQAEIRELVQITLRTSELKVIQADNGQKAVDIALSEQPDLIIMDIDMPGTMNGLEAARTLKSNPKTRNITIVMLTGKDREEDRQRGKDAGADDYFTKPFSPLELIKKVEDVLG